MAKQQDSGRLLQEKNGSCTGSFGPFILQTALQPIFTRTRNAALSLCGFEGLLRLLLNGRPYRTADFFSRIGNSEKLSMDALCRRMHLANASVEPTDKALLFLNFNPSLYEDARMVVAQVNTFLRDVADSQFSAHRIVCEITEQQVSNTGLLPILIETLRESGFKIAVDDFGAKSSDVGRVELVRPDIIKLDADWVTQLMGSKEGFAVLKDTVSRFHQAGASVVVEGMEKGWQIDLAWRSGTDMVQGYALARPQIAPTNFVEIYAPTHSDQNLV